jgi:SAM-dependent methyltransferase
MVKEASKTKSLFGELEEKVFKGSGLDIGCGDDPIFADVRKFDIEDGDANNISSYVNEHFDYVFSSHCLEYMYDPHRTLKEWWSLVKDGGYLYVVIPDEDIYEQGNWPSKFNGDHKHTFTIFKRHSWSPVSVNVMDMIKCLKNAKVIKIEIQDRDYWDKILTKP